MKKSIIVELVGPAGAGKSTLSKALQERSARVRLGVFPDVRAAKNIPFFAWNALLLLPTFLNLYRHKTDRFLSLREMAYLAILKGWHRILRGQSGLIILDQGPVYILGELLRYGPHNLTGPAAHKWWDVTCKEWAEDLDMVICLDATDSVLVERIRNREKKHVAKEKSDQWVKEFLAHCLASQEKVLFAMNMSAQNSKLFCFDTSKMSINEIVDNIFALF